MRIGSFAARRGITVDRRPVRVKMAAHTSFLINARTGVAWTQFRNEYESN
jgi:hypothetical protein